MQFSKENILHTIFGAVDEVNQTLAEEQRLEKSPGTLLAGDNGSLDSLGMINFIVEVEGRVQRDFNLALNKFENTNCLLFGNRKKLSLLYLLEAVRL
jgi:hypothetical protein